MNKIQIKAEILATLTALMTSTQPQASLITDLKILMIKNCSRGVNQGAG